MVGTIRKRAKLPNKTSQASSAPPACADHGHGPLHTHAAAVVDDGEAVRVEAAGCLTRCACCRYVLGRVGSA